MEMEIMFLLNVFWRKIQSNNEADICSVPGSGLDRAMPAYVSQALAHIAQTVAGCWRRRP
jgi:hypothetical protein